MKWVEKLIQKMTEDNKWEQRFKDLVKVNEIHRERIATYKAIEALKHNSPEQVCKAAMIARGAPRDEVSKMEPGRKMDVFTHLIVMEGRPWDEVVKRWEEAIAQVIKEQKS